MRWPSRGAAAAIAAIVVGGVLGVLPRALLAGDAADGAPAGPRTQRAADTAGPAASSEPSAASGDRFESAAGDAIRAALRATFDAQLDAARRAREVVDARVALRRAERARRAGLVYRALRSMTADRDAFAAARRRVAARFLLASERAEVDLLDDEARALAAAEARIAADRARIAALPLPERDLAWPVPGHVLRRFGSSIHSGSQAVLSRRGIDLAVDEHAEISAVADGTVRYAGPIRGKGAGVVIDHGRFLSVTSGLAPASLPAAGTQVGRGTSIGKAAGGLVYLEIRMPIGPGGTPINPDGLLAPR